VTEAIRKRLLHDRLPGISEKSLAAFFSLLIQNGEFSSEPFSMLLKDGCSPAMIQSALIEQRNDMFEDGSLSAEALREIIKHFDRLEFLFLQAIAGRWQARVSGLESRLSVVGAELQMASERSRWAREGTVTLYNYFHEVPITARVAVRGVREDGIGVERNADLIRVVAACQHGYFAHIRLSDLNLCLRLEVESVDSNRVNFKFAGIFKTAPERRRHIRVQCNDALTASLTDASGNTIEAVVRDLSQGGLCLEVKPLSAIQVGDQLDFQLNLSKGQPQGTCLVRWVGKVNKEDKQSSSRQTFGVELDMTQAILRRLQLEVSQREKRILNDLRMLGIPDRLI